jgi:hypothetical protein
MGASWPWLESGEPIVDEDSERLERFEEGTRVSSSGYMYGASV